MMMLKQLPIDFCYECVIRRDCNEAFISRTWMDAVLMQCHFTHIQSGSAIRAALEAMNENRGFDQT